MLHKKYLKTVKNLPNEKIKDFPLRNCFMFGSENHKLATRVSKPLETKNFHFRACQVLQNDFEFLSNFSIGGKFN